MFIKPSEVQFLFMIVFLSDCNLSLTNLYESVLCLLCEDNMPRSLTRRRKKQRKINNILPNLLDEAKDTVPVRQFSDMDQKLRRLHRRKMELWTEPNHVKMEVEDVPDWKELREIYPDTHSNIFRLVKIRNLSAPAPSRTINEHFDEHVAKFLDVLRKKK